MYPVSIRFGIGFGDISTDIDMDAAIGADGPAFYAARNAINSLHDSERKLKARSSDVKIEFYNMEDRFLLKESVNALLSLTKIIEYGWNENYSGVLLHSFDHALTKYDDKWNKVISCSFLTVCGDSLLVTLLL